MATTDTIVLVKEARTCSYVLVVHTPRLCGEPGFMSSKEAREQASISCREVVSAEHIATAEFHPDADRPLAKGQWRKTVLPPPAPLKEKAMTAESKYNDVILRALKALRANGVDAELLDMDGDSGGAGVIQFLDDLPDGDDLDPAGIAEAAEQGADRIANIFRDAGIDVQVGPVTGKLAKKKKKNGDEKQDAADAADRRREVDEL